MKHWLHHCSLISTEQHTTENHTPHHSIIPLWIYRIPSELRSQARLGPISTAVGDHAGILGVECFFCSFAIFFCWIFFFIEQLFFFLIEQIFFYIWSAYITKTKISSFDHTTVDIPYPIVSTKRQGICFSEINFKNKCSK